MIRPCRLLLIMLAGLSGTALAANPGDRISLAQHLGESLPLQHNFIDSRGETVKLGDYFKQRPVVLIFAYYTCPNLCDTVLSGTFQALEKTGLTPGKDYELVIVGIDPQETSKHAAAKRQELLTHYAFVEDHAHFLTGRQPDIAAVTEAAGFNYDYDEKLQQYAHAAGLLIASPDGRLSRYLYGVRFDPMDLRLSLVEASNNVIGSPIDQILLLCSHYDPQTGKYGVLIMNVLRLGGGLAVMLLGGFIAVMLWRERHRRMHA